MYVVTICISEESFHLRCCNMPFHRKLKNNTDYSYGQTEVDMKVMCV